MKVVLICGDTALQKTLTQQFEPRQHSITWVEPNNAAATLSAHSAYDDEDRTVVIDIASYASIQSLQTQLFSQISFEQLVQISSEHGVPYLLLSDCCVFANGKQRHREVDKIEAATAEGVAFAQREEFLKSRHPQHLILRIGPMLAADGDNLLTRLLTLLRAGGEVSAASEPRFCPVVADDLVRVIGAITDQLDCNAQCWGIYHYNSSDAASPYEFAEVVLAAASQYWPLVDRVKIHAAALSAWSGNYPQLHCQLIRDTFGIQQLAWRKAIPELLKRLHETS